MGFLKITISHEISLSFLFVFFLSQTLKGLEQYSSNTDTDEIYDMAAVRDLSTSNTVFKSVINNKLEDSMVACLALEAIMKDQVGQLNTNGVTAMVMRID